MVLQLNISNEKKGLQKSIVSSCFLSVIVVQEEKVSDLNISSILKLLVHWVTIDTCNLLDLCT